MGVNDHGLCCMCTNDQVHKSEVDPPLELGTVSEAELHENPHIVLVFFFLMKLSCSPKKLFYICVTRLNKTHNLQLCQAMGVKTFQKLVHNPNETPDIFYDHKATLFILI